MNGEQESYKDSEGRLRNISKLFSALFLEILRKTTKYLGVFVQDTLP